MSAVARLKKLPDCVEWWNPPYRTPRTRRATGATTTPTPLIKRRSVQFAKEHRIGLRAALPLNRRSKAVALAIERLEEAATLYATEGPEGLDLGREAAPSTQRELKAVARKLRKAAACFERFKREWRKEDPLDLGKKGAAYLADLGTDLEEEREAVEEFLIRGVALEQVANLVDIKAKAPSPHRAEFARGCFAYRVALVWKACDGTFRQRGRNEEGDVPMPWPWADFLEKVMASLPKPERSGQGFAKEIAARFRSASPPRIRQRDRFGRFRAELG
jgi:hypothetical protein